MPETEKNIIQFVGLNNLDERDQEQIKEIFLKEFQKVEREIRNINNVRVHFKIYEKGGNKKYSVKMLINAPTKPVTVNHMTEPASWDPVACVHKLIEKAVSEIKHKYKTDSSYDKPYEKGRL